MIVTRRLTDNWTLTRLAGPSTAPDLPDEIAATVPGTVHTDLLAARLIPDPYLDVNEIALDWIGRSAWRYASEFDWSGQDHENHELVFEGLDTVADIRLNGQPIGSTRNMNRSYRFDVAALLCEGRNRLEVDFLPVEDYGAEVRAELGSAADIRQTIRAPGPSCARWPAILAGTGVRHWSRQASGKRFRSKAGPARGSARCDRRSPLQAGLDAWWQRSRLPAEQPAMDWH